MYRKLKHTKVDETDKKKFISETFSIDITT